MVPLLLLSIAVLSAGMERLMHWIRWNKEQPETIRMFRSELKDLDAVSYTHLTLPTTVRV